MSLQSQAPAQAPVILLTRPEAQSLRFAEALRRRVAADIRIVISPLIAPRYLTPDLPQRQWSGLILASETAVEAARRIIAEPLPAYCVGDRTAQVATQAGYAALSADGDARALLGLILAQKAKGPLLHLHGKEVSLDLGKALNSAGIETFSAVSYLQEAQGLTAEGQAVLAGNAPVFAPLFSARTAEILVKACRANGVFAPMVVVAISQAVAEIAQPLAPVCEIAVQPDAEHMLQAITRALTLKPTPRQH